MVVVSVTVFERSFLEGDDSYAPNSLIARIEKTSPRLSGGTNESEVDAALQSSLAASTGEEITAENREKTLGILARRCRDNLCLSDARARAKVPLTTLSASALYRASDDEVRDSPVSDSDLECFRLHYLKGRSF